MTSEGETSEHAHRAYSHASGMENILPPSIVKLQQPLQSAPKLERSMVDSFVFESGLEHDNASTSPSPPPRDEILQPLSNLAQLSFVKTQRNHLRTELQAQQIASAEARASVAALRRLAFRLAVNISVKEKQIANAAKRLASSRKNDYNATRRAERKIETLKKSLEEEARKNRDILQTLDRASKLTLQCEAQSFVW
jgi:hypothetical protein